VLGWRGGRNKKRILDLFWRLLVLFPVMKTETKVEGYY